MSDFEREIVAAAKASIIKLFRDGGVVAPDYANRVKVPADLANRVYALIDYEQVLTELRPMINQMVADTIVASIASELKVDVKKALSHEPTRLRLRAVVSQEMDALVHGEQS